MPPRKRQAAAPETPVASAGRRSTRIGSSGKKSQYFEASSDDEIEDSTADEFKATNGNGTGRKRGRPRKNPASRPTSTGKKKAKIEQDDDDSDEFQEDGKDEEEDDDNELDEDEEPRVTITPLNKMRGTGGVDYEDDRLHPNTLLFLKDLKANNKRSWLKSNDPEYRRSLQDWNTYVESLMQRIIAADPTIPELPLKDVVFRIYRDIRFSNDPTPYKPHYSVAFSRTGRKGPYACYYVHCEPGSCFVGGGLWHPDASHLAKLRASIDERPRRWRRVLVDDGFRAAFLPGAKRGDEKSCLKAFCKASGENALKTKPKGFDADHRDIELLKLRNFTVGKKIPDSALTAEDSQDQITDIIRAMVGYVGFLNDVVMPDPNLDSDSSSEEEDGDENGDGDEDDNADEGE
ncbi:hypothetical protein INS49_009426 [Diaporthe citri]|uniref:uncharacterized protein n=1 Tax=Diaporthe citri TaxID=83186 RepID=UPI001C7EE1C6|nr:uncharacterized protein INS49_009426 [Diaporthe citri]KAG6361202.1 hypothetical protein INS49_009426 [Diaporthe citri]